MAEKDVKLENNPVSGAVFGKVTADYFNLWFLQITASLRRCSKCRGLTGKGIDDEGDVCWSQLPRGCSVAQILGVTV